jgi:hypothetical protein
MRNDLKAWYQQHFGSFTSLQLFEIEEISEYELGLIQLPDVNYENNKPAASLLFAENHRELKTILQTVISRIAN